MGQSHLDSLAVSVVVPARDAAPTLERTLLSLSRQELTAPFEVILVDDGSRDATIEIAARFAPLVKVVQSGESSGPGAARNRGAAVARAPVLAFTDADCFPTPRWLTEGLAAMAGADMVQGRVEPDPSVPRSPCDRTVEVTAERGFYETANLLVTRKLFDSVGGFRDWVLEHEARTGSKRKRTEDRRRARASRTPIGEDTLFAWNARRVGARTAFASAAAVHHAVVPGTLRDAISDHWHWSRDMPGLARQVPELRNTCFYRRWFFHSRTARFDLALASVAAAALAREPTALAGVLPYVRWLTSELARRPQQPAAAYLMSWIATDATTFAGLLVGSAAWRSLLV
jgi:glycosyltransferase involved in cell wall biosynthesis